ncbi:hypothetical protein DRE_05145 [Drechslerella stenobrocha 248]|uniref:Uncharacterized protein n=1 Tax=Drechslerella stenobrocha 248 TaxID=1043628 RepID=W7I0P8_9PEZI|nr:hypothetical protein DRE_05145 [Drechslerella stenobrocha 248]
MSGHDRPSYTLPSIPTTPLSPLSWQPLRQSGSPDTDYSRQNASAVQSRRPSLDLAAPQRALSPASVGPKSPDMPAAQMPSIAEVVDAPPRSRGADGTSSLLSLPPARPTSAVLFAGSDGAAAGRPRTGVSLKEAMNSWHTKPKLRIRVAVLLLWAVVFIVILAIYLVLFVKNRLSSPSAQIALILIIMVAAFFFFHSLVRVCLVVARPFSYADEERPGSSQSVVVAPIFAGMTPGPGPWGYAQPPRPIQVYAVPGQNDVALDDDSDDDTTGAAKEVAPPPPAYGFWRQTVRVNPAQFYWVRRSQSGGQGVYSQEPETERTAAARASVSSTGTRPPSYISQRGEGTIVSPRASVQRGTRDGSGAPV